MSTNGQKHQFIKKVLWFLPFYLFTFLPLNLVAQTFLDRLQKPVDGQGTVTVHQDTAINRIVLDPQSTVKPEDRKPTTTTSNTATTTTTGTTTTSTETTTTTTTPTTTTTRTRHTINGYKVQAFAGGNSREDRKKAERIASEIRAQLPNVSVSAHFYSPRWVCRVGNYRTREEAQQMLTTLKNMGYSQALIVKSKVSVY
jgi:cell division septation protein DedD